MRAVVDRIEDDKAVLLIGEEEIRIDIYMNHLPVGTKEGSWLKIIFELDSEGESLQRDKISKLLDKLKNKEKSD